MESVVEQDRALTTRQAAEVCGCSEVTIKRALAEDLPSFRIGVGDGRGPADLVVGFEGMDRAAHGIGKGQSGRGDWRCPMSITIDPDFRALIPPLSDEERQQLEANIIVAKGCTVPLVVWAPHGILLDGHHRHEICERLGLPYRVVEIQLPDRDAAEDWMDANQLGRRNLSPDQANMLRGRRYNRAKKKQGGTGANQHSEQTGQNVQSANTAARLAAQHGVDERTVRRDGAFVTAVAAVKAVDPEIERKIIAGMGPSKSAVMKAAQVVESEPEKAKAILCGVRVTEAPADREKPWSEFEAGIREEMGVLRGVANRLREKLGYDSGTKQLGNKWARFYSHGGTIGSVNQLIRILEDGLPAELDERPRIHQQANLPDKEGAEKGCSLMSMATASEYPSCVAVLLTLLGYVI